MNNLLWMAGRGRVGAGGEVLECWEGEALITCRLIFVSGLSGSGEEEEDMVWPGGRPESAHRLRIPMVRKTEEVRRR